MKYRLFGLTLVRRSTNILSSAGTSALRGRPWLMRFRVFPPSNDLLPERSKTRNEGSGRFASSSRAFPDDFRRVNPFGNLIIGIDYVTSYLQWPRRNLKCGSEISRMQA